MAFRRRNVVLVGVLLVAGSLGGAQLAAAADAVDTVVTMPQASLDDVDKKLDAIRQRQDGLKHISQQLDQVLKNQARILEDLDIVKVRASHAR